MFTDDSFEKKGFDAETFEAKGGFDRNCKVCKGTGWMPKKGDPKDAKTAKLLGLSIDELTMQPCNAGGKDMGCFNAETFDADSTPRFIPVEVIKYDAWWTRRYGREYNPMLFGNDYDDSYAVCVRDIPIAHFDTKEKAENHANTVRTAISVVGGVTPSTIDHPLVLTEMDGYADKNIRGGMNMAETFGAEIGYGGAKSYARSLDSKFDGANDEGYFPVDEDEFSEMVVDEIGEHTTLDAESFNDPHRGRDSKGRPAPTKCTNCGKRDSFVLNDGINLWECDKCFHLFYAESFSADESLPNFVAFGDGDAISYSQCLTCSKVGDYDDDQELCNSCNMKYDYRYSPVAGFYLNAESFGAESSGLTRLPSDEPNFSPQKADRNKDGEISSWERTVSNKVAKEIREGRKTSSKGIDAFAEPFEEIGISKPYARLGVIAAGITALAFGVNKLRK